RAVPLHHSPPLSSVFLSPGILRIHSSLVIIDRLRSAVPWYCSLILFVAAWLDDPSPRSMAISRLKLGVLTARPQLVTLGTEKCHHLGVDTHPSVSTCTSYSVNCD